MKKSWVFVMVGLLMCSVAWSYDCICTIEQNVPLFKTEQIMKSLIYTSRSENEKREIMRTLFGSGEMLVNKRIKVIVLEHPGFSGSGYKVRLLGLNSECLVPRKGINCD